jgi:hypothetical protein
VTLHENHGRVESICNSNCLPLLTSQEPKETDKPVLDLQHGVPPNDCVVQFMLLDAFRRNQNCCSLIPSCSNYYDWNGWSMFQFVAYRASHSPTNFPCHTDTYRPCFVNENASNHYAARVATYPCRRADTRFYESSQSFILSKINPW